MTVMEFVDSAGDDCVVTIDEMGNYVALYISVDEDDVQVNLTYEQIQEFKDAIVEAARSISKPARFKDGDVFKFNYRNMTEDEIRYVINDGVYRFDIPQRQGFVHDVKYENGVVIGHLNSNGYSYA